MSGLPAFLDEVYIEPEDTPIPTRIPLDNYEVETGFLSILVVAILIAIVITAIVLIVRAVMKNRKNKG